MKFGALHVISGFRRELDENRALQGYYAPCSGKFLPVFRDTLSVPSSGVDVTERGSMGPIGCSETSVISYNYTLRNNPEERCSQVW